MRHKAAIAVTQHTRNFGVANVGIVQPRWYRRRHCQLWRNLYDLPTRIGQSKPDCVNMCHVFAFAVTISRSDTTLSTCSYHVLAQDCSGICQWILFYFAIY